MVLFRVLPRGFQAVFINIDPVSYTHLDVYKRQLLSAVSEASLPPPQPASRLVHSVAVRNVATSFFLIISHSSLVIYFIQASASTNTYILSRDFEIATIVCIT